MSNEKKLKAEFRVFLNKPKNINEVTKRAENVYWKEGFSRGTGVFKIQDEKYEIEIDSQTYEDIKEEII